MEMLSLTSTAFKHGDSIPLKYTCDGEQTVNPPLTIRGIPGGTQSLVLLMEDPDIPKKTKPDDMFDHWVLFNIPPVLTTIAEATDTRGRVRPRNSSLRSTDIFSVSTRSMRNSRSSMARARRTCSKRCKGTCWKRWNSWVGTSEYEGKGARYARCAQRAIRKEGRE